MIPAVLLCYLAKERPEKFWPGRTYNPDLLIACAVLQQLSDPANWEMVIMWVNEKPVDSEYTRSS